LKKTNRATEESQKRASSSKKTFLKYVLMGERGKGIRKKKLGRLENSYRKRVSGWEEGKESRGHKKDLEKKE